jgi:hypothetical protein
VAESESSKLEPQPLLRPGKKPKKLQRKYLIMLLTFSYFVYMIIKDRKVFLHMGLDNEIRA